MTLAASGSAPWFAVHRWVLVATVTSLGFAIALAVMMVQNAVDLPFFDEWGLVPYLSKSIEGELGIADILAQDDFGAHRIAVSRIILIALARASGWNTNYELIVTFTLGCVLCMLMFARVLATAKLLGAPDFVLAGIATSATVLSFPQYENWLWGWQICVLSAVSASTGALLLLTSQRVSYVKVAAAIACALLATYSYAIGLLSWPLGFLALLLMPTTDRRRKTTMVLAWTAVFAAVMVFYFHDFHFPSQNAAATGNPTALEYARYILIYIGSPFAGYSVQVALIAGSTGAVLFLLVTAHGLLTRFAATTAIYSYLFTLLGLGSGLMTTAGRVRLGDFTALAPRYITVANFFWVGLFLYVATLLWPRLRPEGAGRIALRFTVVAIVAFMVFANVRALETIREHTQMKRVLRYKLLNGDRDEGMKQLYLYHNNLGSLVEILKRERLWAWRAGAPKSLFEPPPLGYAEKEYVRGNALSSEAGDYAGAFRAWSNAAERGYAPAQYNLALLYAQGQGVEQDHQQAGKWYRKAAEAGIAEAQLNLAGMYERGLGVTRDLDQAIAWYDKAAAHGMAEAQYRLGAVYVAGGPVPQDFGKAFDAWTAASGQGHPRAQLNLGVMYARGIGVARDEAAAAALYEKAARQGLPDAQFSLAELFAAGTGVPQNDAEAFAWYQIAEAGGHTAAAARRQALSARMDGKQVLEAESLARQRVEEFQSSP